MILYVDPNNVSGVDKHGVPITPDYTDLCMSFNLIVETRSRYNMGGDLDKQYIITWSSNINDTDPDKSGSKVSFLQGADVKNYNYLTTYYTDLNHKELIERNNVEGLGVTSINISHDNYYLPTVTITFVDVMSASLFGREEIIHEGEKITSESVFGVFFTQPYPKFRLQVKGFYGDAVTYQLMCSDFKSEFDSSSGNTVITATFLGYNYSLLTDIPINYLIAVPYSSYFGRDYWDNNKNNPSWRLSNGESPKKLFDLFLDIRRAQIALENSSDEHISNEDSEIITNNENKKLQLNSILADFNSIKELFIKCFGENNNTKTFDDVENKTLYVFPERDVNGGYSFGVDFSAKHGYFLNKIDNYYKQFSEELVSEDKCIERTLKTTIDGNKKITQKTLKGSDPKVAKLKEETGVVNNSGSDIITYSLYYGEIGDVISEKLSELDKAQKEIEEKATKAITTKFQNSISIKPYIGDIVKILMCHLETFIQMMLHCGDVIDGSKNNRTPQKLNIDLDLTDVLNPYGSSKNFVGPFPSIYSNNIENSNEGIGNNAHTDLWLGDVSPDFEEIKMVKGLFEAVKMINNVSETLLENNTITKNGLCVLPSDFINGNPFYSLNTQLNNTSFLSGVIGMRIAQLFVLNAGNRVGSDKLAQMYGEMDAINTVLSSGDTLLLKTQVLEPTKSNQGFKKSLLDIITCSQDGDVFANTNDKQIKYHPFETMKLEGGSRQPIFTKVDGGYRYEYLKAYRDRTLVPMPILDFTEIKKSFEYDSNNNVKIDSIKDFDKSFHPLSNTLPLKDYINSSYLYNNEKQFTIEVDGNSKAKEIIDFIGRLTKDEEIKLSKDISFKINYELLKKQYIIDLKEISKFWSSKNVGLKIGEYERGDAIELYENHIEHDIRISEDDFGRFITKDGKIEDLVGSVDKFNVGVEYVNGNSNANSTNTGGLGYKGCFYLTVNTLKHGKEIVDGIPTIDVEYGLFDGKVKTLNNLFGSRFYYSLNERYEYDEFNHAGLFLKDEANTPYQHAIRRKSFLFVNTLECNIRNVVKSFRGRENNGSLIAILPYQYVLIVGAYLYRKRLYECSGNKYELLRGNLNNANIKYRNLKLPGVDTTLFAYITDFNDYTDSDSIVSTLCLSNEINDVDKLYQIKVEDILPFKNIDTNVENEFIRVFLDFTDRHFTSICIELELHRKDGISIGYDEIDEFIKSIDVRRMYWLSEKGHAERLNKYFIPPKGKYSVIGKYEKSEQLFMFIDDNSPIQGFFKALYNNVVVLTSSSNNLNVTGINKLRKSVGDINVVPDSIFETYITAYANKLEEICGVDTEGGNSSETTSEIDNKDLALSMYLELKNIWDRWIIGIDDRNSFNVSKFFDENFMFMDSFYKNIYRKFFLNYDKVIRAYTERRLHNASLYTYLTKIASDHNMLFLAMSDFNNIGDEDATVAQQNLERVFLPVPYNKMSNVRENNKFVFIYTHKPSSQVTNGNTNTLDTYNIWDYNTNSITPLANKLFNTSNNTGNIMTRYGYNVPSFGVTFSRQNNHLFKSIKCNTNNPVQTEVSIHTLSNVAQLGSSTPNRVSFYGQDIYPIFSNYSYECEIEMMGCAKISPLMYFQLMNVPMWRGTYMIYNVSHSITPGDFTTRFKGMKMSAKSLPYNTNYAYAFDGISVGETGGIGGSGIGIGINGVTGNYPVIKTARMDYLTNEIYHVGNVNVNGVTEELKTLYNNFFETLRTMYENGNMDKPYGPYITHVMRSGSGKSQHYRGEAVDVKVALYENGYDKKPTSIAGSGDSEQKELLLFFDILYTNFRGLVSQAIIETKSGLSSNSYVFYLLHIACKRGDRKSTQFFMSNNNNGGWTADTGARNLEEFKKQCTPEFVTTLARGWKDSNNDINKFFSTFINLGKINKKPSKADIEKWLGAIINNKINGNGLLGVFSVNLVGLYLGVEGWHNGHNGDKEVKTNEVKGSTGTYKDGKTYAIGFGLNNSRKKIIKTVSNFDAKNSYDFDTTCALMFEGVFLENYSYIEDYAPGILKTNNVGMIYSAISFANKGIGHFKKALGQFKDKVPTPDEYYNALQGSEVRFYAGEVGRFILECSLPYGSALKIPEKIKTAEYSSYLKSAIKKAEEGYAYFNSPPQFAQEIYDTIIKNKSRFS